MQQKFINYCTRKESIMKVLTINEAAELLKVNRNKVSELIKSGKIKATLVGSQYRILESDLKELFQ